jgi:hypothetical protein
MNLSLKELNELVYCVGRVIEADPVANSYQPDERQKLFNKLYDELEARVKDIEESIVPLKDYDLSDIEEGSLGQFS